MFIIPLLYSARIIDPLTARDLQKQEVYLIELSVPRKKKKKMAEITCEHIQSVIVCSDQVRLGNNIVSHLNSRLTDVICHKCLNGSSVHDKCLFFSSFLSLFDEYLFHFGSKQFQYVTLGSGKKSVTQMSLLCDILKALCKQKALLFGLGLVWVRDHWQSWFYIRFWVTSAGLVRWYFLWVLQGLEGFL